MCYYTFMFDKSFYALVVVYSLFLNDLIHVTHTKLIVLIYLIEYELDKKKISLYKIAFLF